MNTQNYSQDEKLISNEDIKRLILERLKQLSQDTIFSIGSEESINRDQLIKQVEDETSIGELFAEMQIEWMRSFKHAVE